MKNKLFILGLMIASSAAAEPYQHEGVITEEPEAGNTIIISNQTYHIDSETRVHGIIAGNELGPQPQLGSKVGFNLDLRDETHYITDIWPLENNE
jgi:hypothetical protein